MTGNLLEFARRAAVQEAGQGRDALLSIVPQVEEFSVDLILAEGVGRPLVVGDVLEVEAHCIQGFGSSEEGFLVLGEQLGICLLLEHGKQRRVVEGVKSGSPQLVLVQG